VNYVEPSCVEIGSVVFAVGADKIYKKAQLRKGLRATAVHA